MAAAMCSDPRLSCSLSHDGMCALNLICIALGVMACVPQVMAAVCSQPVLRSALTHGCRNPEGESPWKDHANTMTPNQSPLWYNRAPEPPRWYDRASGPESTPRRAGERWSIAEMARWDAIAIADQIENERSLSQRLYRSLVIVFEAGWCMIEYTFSLLKPF
jgi:hypothetical protein